MTTSNDGLIEFKPSIDSLLKANTYQEMSDSDIQRLIDYKCEQASSTAAYDHIDSEIEKTRSELERLSLDAYEKSSAAVERAINMANDFYEYSKGVR